jgi:hypothetical protein
MDTVLNPRILFFLASLAHFLGAMEVLGYNVLLRRALGTGMSSPIVKAGILFILVTQAVGAWIGRRLTRPEVLRNRSPLFLPLVRGGISATSWLLSIPILTVVALRTQGYVHPVGFPHFVASVVIACLISTAYSSICNLWLALELVPEAARDRASRRQIERFVRVLPLFASLVPLVATAVYFCVFRPWLLLPGAGKPLEMLIVAMIALGCYGTLLSRWATSKMTHRLARLPIS